MALLEVRIVLDTGRTEDDLALFIQGLLASHGMRPELMAVDAVEEMVPSGI